MSSIVSLGGPPPAHSNVREANPSKSPLDKNYKGNLTGPGASLDNNRKVSQMITGQVNAANLSMGSQLNIFV